MTSNAQMALFHVQIELGSFVDAMGEEKFRKGFMRQEKIPGFVWYLVFKPGVKKFKKEFTVPIESLKSGVVVAAVSRSCFAF